MQSEQYTLFDANRAIINTPTIDTNHNTDNRFIVCCYFTENYRELALSLKASLDKFNLPYCLQPVEDAGYWEANTRLKPVFLRDCLRAFPDKDVLYLDADAVVKKTLDFFNNVQEDLAIYVANRDDTGMSHGYLTGTVFIKNNPTGEALLTKWVEAQHNGSKTQVDQDSIEIAIQQLAEQISIAPLPLSYVKIFDKEYEGDIYIEQYQASRSQTKLRRKRIRRRNQALILLLVALGLTIGYALG